MATMKAKSISAESPETLSKVLAESMADGFSPTLAITFLSIKQDREAIRKILDTAGISIYGATSNGEFTGAGITKESIAILLLDINPAYFDIYFSHFSGKNYQETTRTIASKAMEKIKKPSFLIAGSHLETDAEALLHGFQDVVGQEVSVYGGMAGDDYQFSNQFVFTHKCWVIP